MSGVDVLVFSKDRAAQLDLLLRSIREHASSTYGSIVVLWTASSGEHELGYVTCCREHGGPATFIREESFESQVAGWLGLAGERVSFLVDDDVFYRAAPPVGWTPYSFRGGDFDYPFSVDGNVYERRDIVRLLDELPFTCPTELEWFAHEHRSRLPFKTLTRPPWSCLVGVPANRVATVGGMPHLGIDVDGLLERYLDGWRLELEWCPALEFDLAPAHLPAAAGRPYRWIPAAVTA